MAPNGPSREKRDASFWNRIEQALLDQGIDLQELAADAQGGPPRVKVVCIRPDLGASVVDLTRSARDQVVMVRVDDATVRALDAWVQTGAVKSRSEAAALFIREGLDVRRRELTLLGDALDEVEKARKALREQALAVFGTTTPGALAEPATPPAQTRKEKTNAADDNRTSARGKPRVPRRRGRR